MTVSATETSRLVSRERFWERKLTYVWQNGDGHAEQSITVRNQSGVLENMIIAISNPTNDPATVVTIKDTNSYTLLSYSALAKNTTYVKKYPSDMDSIILPGSDFTVNVDPDADSGATSLTIVVILRGLW